MGRRVREVLTVILLTTAVIGVSAVIVTAIDGPAIVVPMGGGFCRTEPLPDWCLELLQRRSVCG